MTTNVGFATLSVIPGLQGFQSSLTRGIDPTMASAGKRAGSRFGSAFKGTLGAIGLFSAASGALRFLGDSVDEGRESVRVGKQTAAVIKSTGGVARVSEKQVGRLAGQLSRVAGIDDEIVQGGANILLTFKSIRNEAGENNKIFDKANQAALDLSVALDKDLAGSATMVGKALNDPVAGMSALGRAGVQFTADQKDAIKNAVETGDTLGAQKIILQELNEQFKGSARAQRTEADRLSVSWGNFKEEIGTALIPILDDLAKFMRKEGIPKAKAFFAVVQDDGVPALKKVAGFAKDAAGEVKDLVDAFNGMPDWVKKGLALGAVGGFAAKKLGVGTAAKVVGGGLLAKGSSPANPMYVLDVGAGLGTGKLGTGSKVFNALGKGGLLGAFGLATVLATKQDIELLKDGLSGAGGGGTRGNPFGGPEFKGKPQELTWAEKFGTSLDDNRRKIFANKQAIEEFGQSVRTRIPRTIETKYTLLGVDVANDKARTLLETLLAIRSLHNENRLEFGPSGSAPTGDPTPPTRGKPPSRGIVVNNNYNVNTIGDAEKFDKQRRQQVAMGGFG